MTGRAVWVTGLGAVSAAGLGAAALGEMLIEGRTGVRSLPELDCVPVGQAVTPPRHRASRHLDRSARFFLAAGEEAWHDAGLDDCSLDFKRCAVLEGSSLGPLADLLTEHNEQLARSSAEAARPSRLVRYMSGAGGASLAQLHGMRGPVLHLSAGSVSAACAIGEAFQKISRGLLDVVVAGGAECPLHPEIIATFRSAGILSQSDAGGSACRPFDRRRNGTVLGEGAGVLVLEAAEHARRRGARARAVVAGFGISSEAYSMTSPDPTGSGVVDAVRDALGVMDPGEIGWIKTHGTGTRLNDAAECRGLAAIYGESLPATPLTSFKPAVGHCLGASAGVETVGAITALERRLVPPTLGSEAVDPELPPYTVAQVTSNSDKATALVLAESFGGRCTALVLTTL
jgi:3-oxoacyl-[acyl-carrier-protein] synthase II